MSEASGDKRKPGRPVGDGPVARLRRELLKDGQLDKLVKKTYDLAMAGDVAAIRILLDRVVPALRTQAAPVALTLPAGTLSDQARALLTATAAGELAPDIASELIRAVAAVVSVEQGDEVKRRLDAIEHGDLA